MELIIEDKVETGLFPSVEPGMTTDRDGPHLHEDTGVVMTTVEEGGTEAVIGLMEEEAARGHHIAVEADITVVVHPHGAGTAMMNLIFHCQSDMDRQSQKCRLSSLMTWTGKVLNIRCHPGGH